MLKIEDEEELERRFEVDDIEKALDESDREAEDPNTKFLTHKEVFEKIRENLKKEKI